VVGGRQSWGAPNRRRRSGRPRWFDVPVVWFGIQLLELLVIVPLVLRWMGGEGWPRAWQVAAFGVAVVLVIIANYAVLRWLRRA